MGIRVPEIRALAKEIGKDHDLAAELWSSGIHEARLLATMIDVPKKVTSEQMDTWTADFDSWDACDQACSNLYVKTPYAWDKVLLWKDAEQEFVKRAAFALIAYLAVHDKKADDTRFLPMLEIIKEAATDQRNFVKKAVNWALRQIGKRSLELHPYAIEMAKQIQAIDDPTARWIASDAIRELEDEKTINRLKSKK